MDEAPYAPSPAGRDHVSRALHVDPLEFGRITEVLDLGGTVEGDLAVLDTERVEVATHWLGAELAHARRRPLGPGERTHVPALTLEALDQSAPDEARSARYERRGHGFDATESALVARAGPEGVAHGDRAGDLRLVAQRVRVAVLVGEHRLGT